MKTPDYGGGGAMPARPKAEAAVAKLTIAERIVLTAGGIAAALTIFAVSAVSAILWLGEVSR